MLIFPSGGEWDGGKGRRYKSQEVVYIPKLENFDKDAWESAQQIETSYAMSSDLGWVFVVDVTKGSVGLFL